MKKRGILILIIVLLALVIAAGFIIASKIMNKEEKIEEVVSQEPEKEPEKKEEIKIFSGDSRPIAVMIDNHNEAWPQAGLNKAYMVYEIIVEGGETRLMALFKGQDVEKIGPVRSSRHYFLDYAMENDAIYTHYGWSPQAESDIKTYNVNNINGITESSEKFWRVKEKKSPHNVITSIEKITQCAEAKKYRTTSNQKSVLNYTSEEVTLEEGKIANVITLPISTLQTVKYEYDAENKVYKRYARNKAQTDWTSGDAITTKNIIVTFCDNSEIKGDEKGRQTLNNIGTFEGYYITNGKAIKIKCKKTSRESKTKYEDSEGNEIKVNDGNTFVNICPTSAKVTFE